MPSGSPVDGTSVMDDVISLMTQLAEDSKNTTDARATENCDVKTMND